jgi:tetratricopeptide (TPR) repeat protein
MSDLPQDIYDQVAELSEEGNVALDEDGRPDEAIRVWTEALGLLPQPQNIWEPYHWLHGSIGEAHRQLRDHQTALDHFAIATGSGEGVSNPFLWMRLGQCLRALGRDEEAVEPLLKAYMMEGEEIFASDGQDDLNYLRSQELI